VSQSRANGLIERGCEHRSPAFRDSLPMNATGKVLKRELRTQHEAAM
jgi:acyl-CoA synthetase (AMP-forming)/AMP-acid ligase II